MLIYQAFFSAPRTANVINVDTSQGAQLFHRNFVYTYGRLVNVLANQIALPLNTRRHVGKSCKWTFRPITKLYEDYSYSVSVTA